MFQRHLLFAGLAFLFAANASISQAAVILRIDITDPTKVTFSSTTAFAENDGDESYLSEGITLIGFFSTEPTGGGVNIGLDDSDLASPEGNFAYTSLFNNSIFNKDEGPYIDLNIAGSGFSDQGFSTSIRALSGSATADLSEWAALLIPGRIGNIYSGNGLMYTGPLIGQYEVIPEPASALLLLTGTASLFYLARRRAARIAS